MCCLCAALHWAAYGSILLFLRSLSRPVLMAAPNKRHTQKKDMNKKKHFVLLAVTPPGRWIFYCRPHLSECERLSFARGTLLKMCGRRAFCPANANIHNSWQKTRCRPGKFSCCCCFCRVFFPDVIVVVVLLSAAIGRPQCIGVLPFCTLEIRGWSNYYFFLHICRSSFDAAAEAQTPLTTRRNKNATKRRN